MRAPGGYRRGLLKISGEALAGERGYGIDHATVSWIANQIAQAHREGHELGIVVGGGNIVRGVDSASLGVPALVGDHMGMIATVLNAMAMKWALETSGVVVRAMSAFPVGNFIEEFDLAKALEYLGQGKVIVFAGGTGNPCFTTDSAAALRAVEIDAQVMIKATQADGVFDKDPNKYTDAVFFESITPQEVLAGRLGVMDGASVEILGRKSIPAIVLNLHREGNIFRALKGEKVGTLITGS
jgi:uridylate kinase